jgi:hypothetical protein
MTDGGGIVLRMRDDRNSARNAFRPTARGAIASSPKRNSMLDRRWFTPKEREAYRRRMALKREATKMIKATDRRRHIKPPSPAPPAPAAPSSPRRYTLADLAMLRRQGRVP